MIMDRLDYHAVYRVLHPGFPQAFQFLQGLAGRPFEPGKQILIPDRLWIVLEDSHGRGHSGAVLEAHRRMIDIQLVLDGEESIGWSPLLDCHNRSQDYDASRDIEFFRERPKSWLSLTPGMFCIFFPPDAHAPLAGTGPVRKAIAKVSLEW